MNQDLKIIKNKYGENMMHLCRELFPTILETEGSLSKILLEKFEPFRFLYNDIIENKLIEEFKTHIYNVFDSSYRKEEIIEKTPSELLDEAGYVLYECKTEEEIQSFKKYYKQGEELCTFHGGRLGSCHVFFAVKKDVENIKRENFNNPKRQDLYGTSVISIQFTKDDSHTLSIKNRYNHVVSNPDATFSNNLDNIIPGLSDSFGEYYGMVQRFKSSELEIPGYVMANDGKYYKYNYEIDNVYYCPNNIIIDNFEVKRYPKEKYIIMDQFILDLKSGKIVSYKENSDKAFEKSMEDCGRPVVYNEGDFKKIAFYKEGQEPIVIILDKCNNIVGLENKNVKEIQDGFLFYNEKLQKINIPNVEFISVGFLRSNTELKEIDLPLVREISFSFLANNEKLQKINIPIVEYIESFFLQSNLELCEIDIPNVKQIGVNFLSTNRKLKRINVSKVEKVGENFLNTNTELSEIDMPNVKQIGARFLNFNNKIEKISLPSVETISEKFMGNNIELREINLPSAKIIDQSFLRKNRKLEKLLLPKLEKLGYSALYDNLELSEIDMPNVKEIGGDFLYCNNKIEKISLPSVETIYNRFMKNNTGLKEIDMPNVKQIANQFLTNNKKLEKINIPLVEDIGSQFLYHNTELKEIDMPNVKDIGNKFLSNNEKLEKINIPLIETIEEHFVESSTSLKQMNVPNKCVIPDNLLDNNPDLKINIADENISYKTM